jgi:hypothetical protein
MPHRVRELGKPLLLEHKSALGLDWRTGVKELPLKDIQAKIYNKIDEVKIGENNQDIVRFNPKVRARFQQIQLVSMTIDLKIGKVTSP